MIKYHQKQILDDNKMERENDIIGKDINIYNPILLEYKTKMNYVII